MSNPNTIKALIGELEAKHLSDPAIGCEIQISTTHPAKGGVNQRQSVLRLPSTNLLRVMLLGLKASLALSVREHGGKVSASEDIPGWLDAFRDRVAGDPSLAPMLKTIAASVALHVKAPGLSSDASQTAGPSGEPSERSQAAAQASKSFDPSAGFAA